MCRRTSGRSGSAFIHRQCLVLAAVARIRVDRTCLRVLIAGRLGQMLSLNRPSLCAGTSLPRLGGAFLSFSLSTLGFGGLLISQLLTLYTTPVVYLYLDRVQTWLRGGEHDGERDRIRAVAAE